VSVVIILSLECVGTYVGAECTGSRSIGQCDAYSGLPLCDALLLAARSIDSVLGQEVLRIVCDWSCLHSIVLQGFVNAHE
jgi:hypothetical protein